MPFPFHPAVSTLVPTAPWPRTLPCLGHVYLAVSTLSPTVPWPRPRGCIHSYPYRALATYLFLPDATSLARWYAPCQSVCPLPDATSLQFSLARRQVDRHVTSCDVPYLERMASPYLEGVNILDVSCHVLGAYDVQN